MGMFLCVFIHATVSDAFMQFSQLRGTGFAEETLGGSYDFRFLYRLRATPRARATKL